MATQYQKLAATLPLRLQRFFRSNPPFPVSSASTLSTTATAVEATDGKPAPELLTVFGSPKQSNHVFPFDSPRPNPFKPHKNPETGRWHPPIYSLRRQADLFKLAHAHGVEDLLPPTIKDFRAAGKRREEEGLRVKGTGVGQKVKGHKWERMMGQKLEKRRQAMLEMPAMIELWKRKSHGRRWKKFPK